MVTEDSGFGFLVARQALLVATLLAPMTVAFGAVFPFAVAAGMKTNDRIVSDLGILYALNTIGAVMGALLCGFALIPSFGLHDTVRIVTIVVAASTFALVFIARVRGRERGLAFVASAIVMSLGFAQPSWDARLLSSGVYKDTRGTGNPDLETWLTAGRLLYYRDGATATVSVRESLGSRSLARRQGRRIESSRHAHAAAPGAPSVASSSQIQSRRDSRLGKRRYAGCGAQTPGPKRGCY